MPTTGRSARMLAILEILTRQGEIRMVDLTGQLGVSPATIRRDLAGLEEQRLLQRTHGGARRSPAQLELPEQLKNARFHESKTRIAQLAIQLIPQGRHVVALSGGSTTAEVARALSTRRDISIVTNSLTTAGRLASHPALQVIMTGGIVRPHSLELVGVLAESTFRAVNIGTAFLGVDGISAASGATTHDEVEARTNKAMASRARRTVVVADASKIGCITLAGVVSCTEIDDLVTDETADTDALDEIRALGVRVHVTTPDRRTTT